MSNYPNGVTAKDFNAPIFECKTLEITVEDLIYDDGYGDKDATLIVDVEQDKNGQLEILTGTYFLIGNNGDELGEITTDNFSKRHQELILEQASKEFLK